MTISNETMKMQYACNGVTLTFNYTFKILDDSDLLIIVTNDTTGVETTLVLTTDYTVTGAGGETGGTVVIGSTDNVPTGSTLNIIRDVPYTQETDYVEGDDFPADSHEDALDKLTMEILQLKDKLARTLSLKQTSEHDDLILPEPVATKYLRWRSDLLGLENVAILENCGTLTISSFGETLVDDHDAVEARLTLKLLSEYYPDPDAADHGAVGTRTIKSLLTTIGTTNKATIILDHSGSGANTTYTVGQNVDWSSYTNVTFKIIPGALISHGAFTVNIPNVEAGQYQIFSGAGAVTLSGATRNACPEWWGFATGSSAAVNATALQAAIDSNAPSIKMAPGTFAYSTGITLDKAIEFKGSGSCQDNGVAGVSTTKLSYTGTGVGITLVGSGTNGKENIHLSDFSLFGTVNATGGILIGTTTVVTKSSLKRIHAYGFTKASGYGIKIAKCLETNFESVYAQGNYSGWVLQGSNTTLSFTNCWSRSNASMGWEIYDIINGSFYQCLAESNGGIGIIATSKGVVNTSFYNWHSESNCASTPTYPPVYIEGASGDEPVGVVFYSPYIGDASTSNVNIHFGNCSSCGVVFPTLSYGLLGIELAATALFTKITMAQSPKFSVKPTADQENIAVGGYVTVVFGTEIFDVGGYFAANTFTAPITDKYPFSWYIELLQVDSASTVFQIELVTSNRTYYIFIDPDTQLASDSGTVGFANSVLADMDAADTAYIRVYQTGGAQQTDISSRSYFSGYLI